MLSKALIGVALHAEPGGRTMRATDPFDGTTPADSVADVDATSGTVGPGSPGSEPADAAGEGEVPKPPDLQPSPPLRRCSIRPNLLVSSST